MASNQAGAVTIDAREALCGGICNVLVTLPRSQQQKPFQVLFIPTLECLRTMTKMADECSATLQGSGESRLDSVLSRVADEIKILSVMTETYHKVASNSSDMQESQGEEPFLSVLRQAWPSISHAAEAFNKNEVSSSVTLLSRPISRLHSLLCCVNGNAGCFVGVGKIPRREFAA